MKNKVIETRTVEGMYGIDCEQAVIQSENFGRIFITQMFGGSGVSGETYRWSQGMAVKLKAADDFAALDADFNPAYTIIEAATAGHDDERPVMELHGHQVAKIAKSAGLV